jgi:lipopolysaccharide transport system ATP-binding protein
MSSSPAISVDGLSKRYVIDHQRGREPYGSLRDSIAAVTKRALLGFSRAGAARSKEEFWALRDVGFEIAEGERVGIIGRNGAGKSTLLKILSRITEPTRGRAQICGRVASLLEVGTGFHPELTGKENIFLNGAILGMSRAEIRRRFDEIVAFAEVERFLDTPVKRYSSGMYVRLAFSVAAHLEPDILLVDEVLAVGDGAFQRKCLGRMGQVSRQGRTILFVSHNMQAVRHLCGRAIWLQDGKVRAAGSSEAVVRDYLLQIGDEAAESDLAEVIAGLPRDPVFLLKDVIILQDGRRTTELINGKPVDFHVAYEVRQSTAGLHVYFQLLDEEGGLLVESIHNGDEEPVPVVTPGAYISRVTLPANFLAPRPYTLRFLAGISGVRSLLPEPLTVALSVRSQGIVNRAYPGYHSPAKLMPHLPWQTTRQDPEVSTT